MNHSRSRQPDYQDYASYPSLWAPELGDQELLMVKIPPGMNQMSEQDYNYLMTLRIGWMIRTWMERSGEEQVQTHRRLAQALRKLYLQESPSLYMDSETKELEPLWWWTQEWAETFLKRNEMFMVHFSETELDFPVLIQPSTLAIQQGLQESHDSCTLENWLSNLTYDMTSD